MKTDNESDLKKILDGIYKAAFVVGILTLPIALFIEKGENKWVSYLASIVFVILHFIRKKID